MTRLLYALLLIPLLAVTWIGIVIAMLSLSPSLNASLDLSGKLTLGVTEAHGAARGGREQVRLGEEPASHFLDAPIQIIGLPCQVAQQAGNRWVVILGQSRQQVVPDPVSRQTPVQIGRVFAVRQSLRLEECQYFAAADLKHRPDELDALGQILACRDAAQPLQPGAAQQPVQHGLGLIVRGVSCGHMREAGFPRGLGQPGIPQAPGHALQVFPFRPGRGSHIQALGKEAQPLMPLRA